MIFWEITYNGNHLCYCQSKRRKIDFARLYWVVVSRINHCIAPNFIPNQILLKEVKFDDDFDFLSVEWTDISA